MSGCKHSHNTDIRRTPETINIVRCVGIGYFDTRLQLTLSLIDTLLSVCTEQTVTKSLRLSSFIAIQIIFDERNECIYLFFSHINLLLFTFIHLAD